MLSSSTFYRVPYFPPMSTSLNAIDQLFKLKELCSAGILTEEEFESKKAEILKVAPLELSDDPVERLAQLGELRGYGILTTDEFESRKAEVLTLAPIGLVAEQAPAAVVPAQGRGRPVLATIVIVVSAIIIWRILASGGESETEIATRADRIGTARTCNRIGVRTAQRILLS